MATVRVSSERVVAAPADQVYTYLADFEHHHPHILPSAFSGFHIVQGGMGNGTIISYRLRVGGRVRDYHAHITEPDPGRVLTETTDDGAVTTFTVTPEAGGSLVRIETCWDVAGGIRGWIERILGPRVLQPIYDDELARLDAYARARLAVV